MSLLHRRNFARRDFLGPLYFFSNGELLLDEFSANHLNMLLTEHRNRHKTRGQYCRSTGSRVYSKVIKLILTFKRLESENGYEPSCSVEVVRLERNTKEVRI